MSRSYAKVFTDMWLITKTISSCFYIANIEPDAQEEVFREI